MQRADLGFLDSVDWRTPDEVGEDGSRLWNIRCRVPFSGPTPGIASIARRDSHSDDEERVIVDDGDGVLLDPEADGDPLGVDEVDLDEPMLSGIASSTSVDFFGTEMSLRALKQMAGQMIADGGIPYLPRHNLGAGGAIEWDSVIGRTIHAEVVPVEADQLRAPKNPGETHFLLRVTTALYDDEPLTRSLVKRIARGEKIGQSIGGWFTQLQVMQNDDGDVERVIVLGVELDHLAVTRAPANPDAIGLVSLRSAISERSRAARVDALVETLGEEPVSVPESLLPAIRSRVASDERHVLAVVDNGDGTVSVTYAIAHDDETEEVEVDEVVEESSEEERAVEGSESEPVEAVRTVTDFADLPVAPIDEPWEWSAEVASEVLGDPPDWDRYRRAHVWTDPENDETRQGYKLPIARMFDGTLRVVFRAVSAALGAVNGARGGVDIPQGERREAYDHLARYYAKFDREPPPFAETLSSLGNDSETNDVPVDLDGTNGTVQDTGRNDARRSALRDPIHPSPNPGEMPEERKMSDQPANGLTLDAIRSLFDEKFSTVEARIVALEGSADRSQPENNPEPETVSEAADLRAMLEAERTRARAAEAALAHATTSRGFRVGRSAVGLSMPTGPGARSAFSGLIERSRTEAPTLSAVAERALPILDHGHGEKPASREDLVETLRSLCNAAEADGLLVPTAHRASWR